jgi:hypothetical protein
MMMYTYSQISIQELREVFGIILETEPFLPFIEPIEVPEWLKIYLNINQLSPALAKSEKAVSEMLITPILSAIKARNQGQVALFSGEPFADGQLSGICDFIISANPKAYLPEPPILILVEAKKQDIYGGIPQCVAEMLVAQHINQKAGIHSELIFGCVTTGTEWLFLRLKGNHAITDPNILYYTDLPKILGVFQYMINTFFEK